MMEQIREKQFIVPVSLCDASVRLGIPDTFAVFMDLAAEHAQSIGAGWEKMKNDHLFCLTAQTKIRFLRRPMLGETVTAVTWSGLPDGTRLCRYYEMRQGEELLAVGKTDWRVIDTVSGILQPVTALYPVEASVDRDGFPEPFARVDQKFEAEPFAQYTVRSTDIDLGGHMNNVAYVRAFAGLFSCREWNKSDITELDVQFRAPCFEGDCLLFRRRQRADGIREYSAALQDGKTVLLVQMK